MASSSHQFQHDEKLTDEQIRYLHHPAFGLQRRVSSLVTVTLENQEGDAFEVCYEFSPIKPAGSDNLLPDDLRRLKHEVPDFLDKLELDVGWCIRMLESLKALHIFSRYCEPELKALIHAIKLNSSKYVLQEFGGQGLEIMDAAASLSSLQSFTVILIHDEWPNEAPSTLDRFVAALERNCIGNNIWHLGIFDLAWSQSHSSQDLWRDAFRRLCTDSRLKALTLWGVGALNHLFMEVMVEEGLPRRLQHLMLHVTRGEDFSAKLGHALEKTEWDPECSLATLNSLHVYCADVTTIKEVVPCIRYGISSLSIGGPSHRHLTVQDDIYAELLKQLKMPGSNLRYLNLYIRSFFSSRKNQVKLVDFLDRHVDCPLETIEGLEWADQSLERNCMEIMKRNKVYRDGGLLTNQMPPSTAKLFICGDSGVGKSTLRKNLTRSIFIPSCLQSSTSTVGIRLAALTFEEKTLVLCDLAGQPEFHTLHHYFVRGSDKDLFLLVCKAPSATQGQALVQDQLKYWLRFIVAHRSSSERKPRVLILMNYFPDSERPFSGCEQMIEDYSDQVDFASAAVYAYNVKSFCDVQKLKPILEDALTGLIDSRGPVVPELCKIILQKMNAAPARPKVVSLAGFTTLYRVDYLQREKLKLKACIAYLHDIGEVVYLESDEDEGKDEADLFIILDVQWFLRDLIGEFLPQLPKEGAREVVATLPQNALRKKIKKTCDDEKHIDYILFCLDRLGITLSEDGSRRERLVTILPLMQNDVVKWSAEDAYTTSIDNTYRFWGRRFDCEDSDRRLLPFGIFNMLQVRLASNFSRSDIGKGWLYLVENRVHIIVKIGGTRGEWYDKHWVDVLVRIPVHPDGLFLETGEELFRKVKTCLHDLCGAANWGCPALVLEEKVISPRCVEQVPGAEIRNVHELKKIIRRIEENNMFYFYTWPSGGETTQAFQLLFPSEVDTLFNDQQRDLDDIHLEVQDCLNTESKAEQRMRMEAINIEDENLSYDGRVIIKRLKSHVTKEVKASEERLTNEIHKLGEVVKKQMAIIKLQGTGILSKLQLHLDFEAPKYPFLINENNFLQKFSALTFGSTSKLHFLCEHEQGFHIVEGQTGREIKTTPEWFKKAAPVLIPTLRILFFTLKIVAVAGLGVVIPTPESAFPGGLKDKNIDAVCEEVFKNMDKRIRLEPGRGPVIPAAAPSGSGSKEKIIDSVYEQALKNVDKCTFPSRNDLEQFRESLTDFLEGKTMRKEFGLYPCMRNGKHVWVCQKHKEPGSSS